MALLKSQKHCKNTPTLKRLARFLIIFFIIFLGSFLFFTKQESVLDSEIKKLELKKLVDFQEIIEHDYKWEIILKNNLKIFIDPEQDLKKQINLVDKALEQITPEEYIGVDVQGQIYYK